MKKYLKYMILLLVAGRVMAAVLSLLPTEQVKELGAAEGAADLRADLSAGKIVQVTSGWESYPGQLYAPADFAAERTGDPIVWENKYGEGQSVGTHRMTLLLPPGEIAAVSFRSVDYATKVYLDGKLVGETGVVGTAKESTTPQVNNCDFIFLPQTEKTEIILQYANFHHRRGGHPPELTVGSPAGLMYLAQKSTFAQVIVVGVLFTAFLYHLSMFLLYGGRRTFLYFALCCLAFAIRAFLPLFTIFVRSYDWMLMIRLEYLDMFAGAALLMLFFHSLFPELLSKRILRTVAALLVIYCVVVVFTEPVFFSRLLTIIQPLCLLAVGYITIKLLLGVKKGGLTVFLAFAGIALFLAAAVNDVLLLNKLPSLAMHLMPAGIVIFTLAYMVILSMEFAEKERQLEAAKINQEKMLAEKAVLEQMSRLKNEFLSNVSHELKTPLTVVSNYAQLSGRQLTLDKDKDEVSGNLRKIQAEADRLALMVGQLLDITRIEEGRIQWNKSAVDIADVLGRTVATHFPMLDQNNNRLEIRADEKMPPVYADDNKIIQVLVNLIANALRYTRNGTITVAAELSAEPGFITVTVWDTGDGIDPEFLPLIFERFQTGESRTDAGTGLGLFITRKIVEEHGGRIWAESKQNRGTVIRFTLPLYARGGENEKQ